MTVRHVDNVTISTKYDSAAIACATFDAKIQKVRLVWPRTFQPSPDDPLDFQSTI
jgi:hypothetical protein